LIPNNHIGCNPAEYMSKTDCDRVHKAQKDVYDMFMIDSKKDRDDLWKRHNELVNSVNDLVNKISGRTIIMLIVVIFGVVGFIGSNIYMNQTSPAGKLSDDMKTITDVVSKLASSQIQFQTGFLKEYEKISGDNNKMLKKMEKK